MSLYPKKETIIKRCKVKINEVILVNNPMINKRPKKTSKIPFIKRIVKGPIGREYAKDGR